MPKKLRPAGDLVVFKYSTLKVNHDEMHILIGSIEISVREGLYIP